jgi:DnaD/phage-associated family protein
MKPFAGFPQKMRFTPLPNVFFSDLLPSMDDITELKVTLHIFWSIYQKRGYPRFVTYGELLSDKKLMAGIGNADRLREGLEQATSRGILIHLTLDREGRSEELYSLNTEGDRAALAKVERGEVDLGALPRREPYREAKEQPNIFTLYEENIGMLTPMIAEELKEAERVYPVSWIEDAFKEAVSLNIRKWRYISSILERWTNEGRENGKRGRHSKEDRDRYIKERYGHLVKRRID